jgi:hypothetical protein
MAAIKDPLKQELKLRTLLLTAYTTFVVFFYGNWDGTGVFNDQNIYLPLLHDW